MCNSLSPIDNTFTHFTIQTMRVIYQIAIIVVGIEVSVARGPYTKGAVKK